MANLRDFVGKVQNQPNITKVKTHNPPKKVALTPKEDVKKTK